MTDYSTGGLTDPRDTDPRFSSEAEALQQARHDADESFNVQPRAVWDDETGEVRVIVYEGIEYRP